MLYCFIRVYRFLNVIYFLCVYIGCKLIIMFYIFLYSYLFSLFFTIYLFIYLFFFSSFAMILNVCNVYIESLNVIFLICVYRFLNVIFFMSVYGPIIL